MDQGYPRKVTLRTGKKVILRPLEDGDEEALYRFFASLPPESTDFLRDDVKDRKVVARWVQERDPDRVWVLLALEEGGAVVGNASLQLSKSGWRRHIGEVRAVVSRELQKQHLATALVHELVNQASLLSLKKLEAQILDVQQGARTVFERFGFREEARLRGHALDLHGKVHDLVILTSAVDDLWKKMEDLIEDLEFART
jgi:RimJ/RimL family protein N-acetyltransferase